MRKLKLASAVWTSLALAGATFAANPASFDLNNFQTRLNAAFAAHDAQAVGQLISPLFNEGGVSKGEYIQQLTQLFNAADVNVNITLSGFTHIPGTNFGFAKILSSMSVAPHENKNLFGIGPAAAPVTFRSEGYATFTEENGVYQLAASAGSACQSAPSEVGASAASPGAWGSLINPASIAPGLLTAGQRPSFTPFTASTVAAAANSSAPSFDKAAWEQRFAAAWAAKNVGEIMSFYSTRYTVLGLDYEQLAASTATLLNQYSSLHANYQVLGIKFFPGSNLASLQAELTITGTPVGSTKSTTVLTANGTASLIAENGAWKVYAVQPSSIQDVGEQKFQQKIVDFARATQ